MRETGPTASTGPKPTTNPYNRARRGIEPVCGDNEPPPWSQVGGPVEAEVETEDDVVSQGENQATGVMLAKAMLQMKDAAEV